MNQFDIEIGTGLIVFLIILGVFLIWLLVFSIRRAIKAHQRRIEAGSEEMLGRTAEVLEALNPKGTVFIEGERWTAVSEEGEAGVGEEVVITRVESLKLYVVKK